MLRESCEPIYGPSGSGAASIRLVGILFSICPSLKSVSIPGRRGHPAIESRFEEGTRMTDPEQALRARASLYGIDSLHRNDRKRLEIMEREKQWREEREREAVAEWLEQQAKSKDRGRDAHY